MTREKKKLEMPVSKDDDARNKPPLGAEGANPNNPAIAKSGFSSGGTSVAQAGAGTFEGTSTINMFHGK